MLHFPESSKVSLEQTMPLASFAQQFTQYYPEHAISRWLQQPDGQKALQEIERVSWIHKLTPEHLAELGEKTTTAPAPDTPPASSEAEDENIPVICLMELKLNYADSIVKPKILELLGTRGPMRYSLFVARRSNPDKPLQAWIRYVNPSTQKDTYCSTPWLSEAELEARIYPQGHSLKEVYDGLVRQILGLEHKHEQPPTARTDESTDTKPLPKHRDLHIDLRITDLESKIAQLEKKCRKEVQLNKKFAIRDKIRALKAELQDLRASAE
ncbi:MAG TPA: DUF4391 domain-containing protein [Candidatus Anaerobiospirillum pullistercoris]|uniref:DUF4391 domain-containing protein n=1 Tax=Candidatus Anaerobiospirillum pullistercoris TaxID=2838452 RepID=A0A9D1WD26_9GAMM|nr:DUF4391 domain-containing protein [Candidatus Anaerobiospirillum pullistercoris]